MANIEDLLEEGSNLEHVGKYDQAHQTYTTIIEQLEFDDPRKAQTFNKRGVVSRMLRNYDDAFNDYTTAETLTDDVEEKALAFVNMADIHRVAHNDHRAAHEVLDLALELAPNPSLVRAKALDQHGLVYFGTKDFEVALGCYEQAKEVCEQLDPEKDPEVNKRLAQIISHEGASWIWICKEEKVLGKLDPVSVEQAYESQLKAFNTFQEMGDQQNMVNTVANLGRLSVIADKPETAIPQYEQAWNVLEQTGYLRPKGILALHLAEAHFLLGQEEQAQPYLETFRDLAISGDVTEHDLGYLKDDFIKVTSLYEKTDLKINGLSDIPFKEM
jgi:tetratricopeptide (TPR) repeat protein